MGQIDGDTAQKVVLDIGQGIPPEKSERLTYDDDLLAFRKRIEDDFAKYRQQYPDAVLDVRD